MANADFEFAELLFRIMARQTGQISRISFQAQKPAFQNRPVQQPFPRSTPEEQGVSSRHVREYLDALRSDPSANPHHVMILRHGTVICECSFAPYVQGMWHITHSMCKSFTGMAVGLAIQEGYLHLDDKLLDIFPQYGGLLNNFNKRKDITIENLLNMTSGVDFSEAGAISEEDWRRKFLSAPVKTDPGTKWQYNSMNSYMLSAAIQEKTGQTMAEYLKSRLFEPMGIDEIFWEASPQGITKGGWGCFIKPEDACKLGYLYLHQGNWHGRQLIDPDWVRASTTKQADNEKYGYGYQIWLEEEQGSFAFNGLFGQDVVVYPDKDMILMINCGNNEITQEGTMTEIMRRFWGIGYRPADGPLPADPEQQQKLARSIETYEHMVIAPRHMSSFGMLSNPVNDEAKKWIHELKGRSYDLDHTRIGMFPLICQVMHYNFTDGISRIRFEELDGQLMVLFYEGEEIHHVRVGLDKPARSQIMLHGEPYEIGTYGYFTQNENNDLTLVLEISYLEEACTRKMVISFNSTQLYMRAYETPGEQVITDALTYMADNPVLYRIPVLKDILRDGGRDFMDVCVRSTVKPEETGHLSTKEN